MDDMPTAGEQRVLSRICADYLLRAIIASGAAFDHDYGLTVIYCAVVQANLGPETDEPADDPADDPGAPLRPISVLALAGRLGMPYETTRRAVGCLMERGFVRRVNRNGIVFRPEQQAEPVLARCAEQMRRESSRLLDRLARAGLTSAQKEGRGPLGDRGQ